MRRGKQALYDYAAQRGVPHRRCGKLIVATSVAQVGELEAIRAKAAANGVDDLVLLTAQQAMAMEPQLHCEAALHSPSTGIVDSHALMLSLLGDVENAGGMLALKSPIARAECGADAIVLVAEDGTALRCNTVVNAAGLGAPGLARRFEGLPAEAVPTAYFAKGNYFTLSGRAPFSRLVYPVPEPGGLGVHLTLDLGGQAKFGPDVQWVPSADDLVVDPARGEGFYAEVRKYWPALPDGALIPGYAGMRPKIAGPGEPARDFMIHGPKEHGVHGLVNLFGIESPGLTSSLAIGRYVTSLLDGG
ncbi:NAD(P)/FAD-dependent oxidoreductase [Variovorax sp. V213]